MTLREKRRFFLALATGKLVMTRMAGTENKPAVKRENGETANV